MMVIRWILSGFVQFFGQCQGEEDFFLIRFGFFCWTSFLLPFALYLQQFGTRACHFAWYLLFFRMLTFHFARYLLHVCHFKLLFCMVFAAC